MIREQSPPSPSQRIVLTGATGFVGRYLVMRLVARGHALTLLVRDLATAKSQFGGLDLQLVELADEGAVGRCFARADTLIHLAGAPVAQRWTSAHKQAMWESRVGLSQRMIRLIGRHREEGKLSVICAGGVGYYGKGEEQLFVESSPAGRGELAELAQACERVWAAFAQEGHRVVHLRIGVVLGLEGGILAKTLAPTEFGLGAILGSGDQYLPWIHLNDLCRMIEWATENSELSGPYNACAPKALRYRDFATQLAESSGGKVRVRVPQWLLRLLLGEMTAVVCEGQHAVPERAQDAGFSFHYPSLSEALEDLLHGAELAMSPARSMPGEEQYIEAHKPNREILHHCILNAPLPSVFDFFSKAENLSLLTPPTLAFDIRTPCPIEMRKGTIIDYRISLALFSFNWRTYIEHFEKEERFVDAQTRGPYACWYHEHIFTQLDTETTKMVDRVYYRVGLGRFSLGPLGRWIEKRFVRPQLRRIFAYRDRMIQARFGCATQSRGQSDQEAVRA